MKRLNEMETEFHSFMIFVSKDNIIFYTKIKSNLSHFINE